MPGVRALALLSYTALLMMALMSRPSSGMRIILLTLLLMATAFAGMSLGFNHLVTGLSGN
jgi:hypothetical protein